MSRQNVKLCDVTNNLDNKRKPLNNNQRLIISKEGLFPYIGANNVMDYVDDYIFDGEILCVAEDGGSWGAGERCANYYNEKCWVNNHAHVLSSNGLAHLKFLMYFLNYADLTYAITGTTRGKLTKSALNEIEISLPPLDVQKKIADILDKADTLRRKDAELIKKYDELAQSIFIDMFGDPVTNPKGWDKVAISLIGEVKTGNTPPRINKDYYGSFIEWIKTDNIRMSSIFPEKSNEYLSKEGLRVGRSVDKNSILVTCIAGSSATIGNVVLTDRMVSFNQQINSLTPNESYEPLFIYFLFRNIKHHIQSSTTNGMKRIITKSSFEKLKLISPPLDAQTLFSSKIMTYIYAKNSLSANQSEQLFQSLLQRAFNGELVH